MKKILAIITVALLSATVAHAQLGIIGGLTSSGVSLDQITTKSISLYHVGLAYKGEIGRVFVIQPALCYQVKGAKLSEIQSTSELELETGFAELSLGLQLGIDLNVIRPFAVAEPFLGYQITGREKNANDVTSMFEYGVALGGGIELFDHVELMVQWFKNMGKVKEADLAKDYNKAYQGIKITLGIFF